MSRLVPCPASLIAQWSDDAAKFKAGARAMRAAGNYTGAAILEVKADYLDHAAVALTLSLTIHHPELL